jgi:hypothetical protein
MHTQINKISTQYKKYNEAYSNHTNNTQYMQVFTFSPHLIHLFVTTSLTLFLKVLNLKGKTLASLQVIGSSLWWSYLRTNICQCQFFNT